MVIRVVDAHEHHAKKRLVEVVVEVTRVICGETVTEMLDPFLIDPRATANDEDFITAVTNYVKHKFRPDRAERFIGLEFTVQW